MSGAVLSGCASVLVVSAGNAVAAAADRRRVVRPNAAKSARYRLPGFKIDRLITFKIDPPRNGYRRMARSRQFYSDLTQRMNGMPGVQAASMTVVPLLDGDEWDSSVTVEGYTSKEGVQPHMNYPQPGLFATLGVPVLVGRGTSTPVT